MQGRAEDAIALPLSDKVKDNCHVDVIPGLSFKTSATDYR